MALTNYLTLTRQLVNDPSAQRYTDANLTTFINIGRSQLALKGQCVRFVFGLDGILFTGTFNGTNSVTNVSPSASQILDTITGANPWVIPNINNVVAQGTTVSAFTGTTMTLSAAATGSGTYQFTVSPPNVTVVNQEVYSTPSNVCLTNGVQNVIGVQSVAVNWGSYGSNLYTANFADWPTFQAFARQYPNLSGNPWYWTRFENVNNAVYLRPIPSLAFPMQWTTTCSVVPLTTDSTPEAIPYSYTDAVPYFAAYLAMMSSQRQDDAKSMLAIYDMFVATGRLNFQTPIIESIYETI